MTYLKKFKDNYFDSLLVYNLYDSNTPTGKVIDVSGEIKFDTGADITIFPASQINLKGISERDFTEWLQLNDKVCSISQGLIPRSSAA